MKIRQEKSFTLFWIKHAMKEFNCCKSWALNASAQDLTNNQKMAKLDWTGIIQSYQITSPPNMINLHSTDLQDLSVLVLQNFKETSLIGGIL